MFFFVENTPGTFIRNKTFRMKNSWSCMQEYYNVNKFCFDVRDRLDEVFQRTMGMKRAQNMSNQEKTALRILHRNKNVDVVINDTDKNVGPACADKDDVINECTRQLYEKRVYNQLTKEKAEQLIQVIKKRLENVVNNHMTKGFCSKKKNNNFHFRIWTDSKYPIFISSGKF